MTTMQAPFNIVQNIDDTTPLLSIAADGTVSISGALATSSVSATVGAGATNAPTTISAAATLLLVKGTDKPNQRLTFGAGSGAYAYHIDLDTTSVNTGATFRIYVAGPASTNPTIDVRNGSGGSALVTINSASAANYAMQFIFDGTNWLKFLAVTNTL